MIHEGLFGEVGESKRFVIKHKLGVGGMGMVYEAFDRERRQSVAIKTLRTDDATALFNLKREFRALADVAHRNLVNYFELFAEGSVWFFTMELISGVSFFDHVRPGSTSDPGSAYSDTRPTMGLDDHSHQPNTPARDTGEVEVPEPDPDPGSLDLERLHDVFGQLCEGVLTLHRAGKLHRDLKPSNVMVTDEGRVVILDFGLATELRSDRQTVREGQSGTVAFMAPEQLAQTGATMASDWYSVGVILFEVLTGRLPFVGDICQMLVTKQCTPAPSPADLAANLPGDFVKLCNDLLSFQPEDRPTGAEVMQALQFLSPSRSAQKAEAPFEGHEDTPLVGRQNELSALEDAFAAAQKGEPVAVYVHGQSGMGKSALTRHFLSSVVEEGRGLVLSGRCYEREMVPFKALDGLVDSLTGYLLSMPDVSVVALLPRDIHALARLFPVLERIKGMNDVPQRRQESQDPLSQRRRAFAALRELLGRISDLHPLVLSIDDLHWADADSTALIEELTRPPDPPPVLLLASFRSEEIPRKPFLRELLGHTGSATGRVIEVGLLGDVEARKLAVSLLGDSPSIEMVLWSIVKEAAGSPFLVEQLVRYIQIEHDSLSSGISLSEMLEARMARLPEGSVALLQTMAVAGRPVDARLVHVASGLFGDERGLIAKLRTAHFVRSSGSAQRIELYGDRIGEILVRLIAPGEAIKIHRRMVRTMQELGLDDPEALFDHCLGAGDLIEAARQAVLAASKAFSALAFDTAAHFYKKALGLTSDSSQRVLLMDGLARSLSNGGRSHEAGEAYLALAELCSPNEALQVRCNAMECFLEGGHIDSGLEQANQVLAEGGFKRAGGPKRALLWLLFRHLRMRVRGLGFKERSASMIPERDLVAIDTCWAMAKGLGLVDNLGGADFHYRGLRLALDAGELFRVTRALALEITYRATTNLKKARVILDRARELADQLDDPRIRGFVEVSAGLITYLSGDWKQAAEISNRAEAILSDCTDVNWEVTVALRFVLSSLRYQGLIGELSRRVPEVLAEAKERGNAYLATEVRSRLNIVWLAADDPAEARNQVREAVAGWSQEGFHIPHFNAMVAEVQIELYCGDVEAAKKCFLANWPALKGSMLRRIQLLRVEAYDLSVRIALALIASKGPDRKLLGIIDQGIAKIARVKRPWSDALATLLRAGRAAIVTNMALAEKRLEQAVKGFEDAGMALHWAVSQRRLGEVLGGEQGQILIHEADTWMAEQGIKVPTKITAMLAPGWPALPGAVSS